MSRWAYYNEIDPFCAEWLRNLIRAGEIADGEVDERDIRRVSPDDVRGFRRCHFFAGIGGWDYALRLAGWPGDRPVWTGSCPCQDFSVAGGRRGFGGDRDLWPEFYRLIRFAKPGAVPCFGEQVADGGGLEWLARVHLDLERIGHRVGAVDLPAACVAAPHRRQRLWWVAQGEGRRGRGTQRVADAQCAPGHSWRPAIEPGEGHGANGSRPRTESGRSGDAGRVAAAQGEQVGSAGFARGGWDARDVSLADAECSERGPGVGRGSGDYRSCTEREESSSGLSREGEAGGPWAGADAVHCRDGKWRRIPAEPEFFPLADGISFRVGSGFPLEGRSRIGMIRGFGNAIVPQVAAKFVRAWMEVEG